MKRNFFVLCCFFIFIFACILRFVRFSDRWGLAYDQTHDVLVAKYAIESRQLPLLGPFSSAGPFQTSGVWYWFIMAGSIIDSTRVNMPWILLTALYVFLVLGMIVLGTYVKDKLLGIIVGVCTTVSTAQIAQSVNLTNQSPLSLTSFGALTSFVLYGKTKKNQYLFLLGFFVSLSASIHLQGVSLSSLVLSSLIMFGIPSFTGLLALLLGLFIPLFPVILFDSFHDFVNISNMVRYVLVDQYTISLDVLGRRWLTFLTNILPYEWSHILGGQPIIGGSLFIGSFLLFPAFLWKEKNRIVPGIFLATFFMVIVLRYTRTPLFSSYFVFLHPFVLLLSSLFIYKLYKTYRLLGVIVVSVIIIFSLQKSLVEIKHATNSSDTSAKNWVNILFSRYPNKSFSVFDYSYQAKDSSLLLSLYLYVNKRIDENGIKLAVMRIPNDVTPSGELLFKKNTIAVYDVSASSTGTLQRLGWGRVNPVDVYNSTEHWMEKEQDR